MYENIPPRTPPVPFSAGGGGSPSSDFVVARNPNHLDVFWGSSDGRIWTTWWDAAPGGSWGDHQPFPITPRGESGGFAGAVTALARMPNHLDVFYRRSDSSIGTTWWDAAPGLNWGDHQPGPITPPHAVVNDSIAVVARTRDHLDVFWMTPNLEIATTWWDAAPGASWWDHQPAPITPRGAADYSSVAALARTPNHLDVFWLGLTESFPDSIASTWWAAAPGASWWDHPPGAPITPPREASTGAVITAVARTPDHLDVFWLGFDGAIWTTWWDASGASWWDHPPERITPSNAASGGTAVVARATNHLDVFWISPDGAIASNWWHAGPGGRWLDHQPGPITPPGAAAVGSAITAVARTPDHLDVFWISPDGAIASTWWDAAPGASWWDHQPGPITPPHAVF